MTDACSACSALATAITAYEPYNQQEVADKALMLAALAEGPACLERAEAAHFTCSAWVVDPARTQTLFVYHKIYDSWSWIGGHADGCANLAEVAARELAEETGVTCGVMKPEILSLEVLPVAGHMKKGAWVEPHQHLNVTYLFTVDPAEAENQLRICEAENTDVRWIPLDQITKVSSEPWMIEHVYKKLIALTQN